jgi:N-acetylneuraminic acid mutarotase
MIIDKRSKSLLTGGQRVRLLLAGLLSLALVALAPAYSAGPGSTWTSLTPVPSVGAGVEGMSVAEVDGEIIAAFGLDPGLGDTNLTRIYDVGGDSWSSGANGPGFNSEGAGTSHGGLFYSVGGRGPMGARRDIWSYDPATDTWNATLAQMSQGRTGPAVAVVGNAIYAIGGRTATSGPCSGGPLASVERYDIDTDTWSFVAPLPFPRSDLAACTVGGKIYVFGGCRLGGTSVLSDVDVYDPETDTWSAVPTDLPTARAGLYAVARKGNTVYVIGGWDGTFPYFGLTTNEAYKVSQDAWTTELPMPTGRGESGAVGHGGRIYIVGGARPAFGLSVAANEAFKP